MAWARRKSVRILGALLAVLLLAVAAVMIFLPAEKIRDLALAQAREKLGREVSVGEVNVSGDRESAVGLMLLEEIEEPLLFVGNVAPILHAFLE